MGNPWLLLLLLLLLLPQAADTRPAAVSERLTALTNLDRVSILAEALPYMQRFAGKTIVVKYGGAAMKDPTLKVGALRVVGWRLSAQPGWGVHAALCCNSCCWCGGAALPVGVNWQMAVV
jgi:hypothetical protein